MTITETTKILAKLLHSGVSKNNAIAVSAIQRGENAGTILWIYDIQPSEEEIMRKAIAMNKEK